jgi:hypothetical protein
VQNLDDETRRRAIDGHFDQALHEVHRGCIWASRNDFAAEVQHRVTQELGPGLPVRDRIEEILDTFISRDDSA